MTCSRPTRMQHILMQLVFMNLYDAHVKILDKVCGQSTTLTCHKDIGIRLHFLKCFLGQVLFELFNKNMWSDNATNCEYFRTSLFLSHAGRLHDLA